MTTFEDISYRVEAGVARITVTRPDKLNAYRNETDTAVKVAILTGEGRAFGSGYDLATIEPGQTPQLDQVLEHHFNPLVRAMRRSRLPIVSLVNGPCAGAAVGIALAADIVLASRSAYFYEPFVGIALVPDAGNTLFLTRMAGRVRAAGMMLLGERVSAEQAVEWGLVWKVFDDAELADGTDRIVARLASLSPHALAATKHLIAAASDPDLETQLDLERDFQGDAGRSPEMKAAIAAFFEARRKV
jgi:2-(1,2-epoxy-1,2-dihydrophenyl)acetyl-CoA isomerase